MKLFKLIIQSILLLIVSAGMVFFIDAMGRLNQVDMVGIMPFVIAVAVAMLAFGLIGIYTEKGDVEAPKRKGGMWE